MHEMTDQSVWLLANLDLDQSDFVCFASNIAEMSPLTGTFLQVANLDDIGLLDKGMGYGLVLFFRRRVDPGMSSVSQPIGGLGRVADALERRQLKHLLRSAILVDCGEMPNAPLSDFNVLGQYFETLNDLVPLPDGALIAALDFERDRSDVILVQDAVWRDTRSQEFVDHMREHIASSLLLLNSAVDIQKKREAAGH
jgi:hypothetical protein